MLGHLSAAAPGMLQSLRLRSGPTRARALPWSVGRPRGRAIADRLAAYSATEQAARCHPALCRGGNEAAKCPPADTPCCRVVCRKSADSAAAAAAAVAAQSAECADTCCRHAGSRLTAYELVHDHIPATLVADSAAAALMAAGRVDAVVVGADRVAANGDTANKIGTLSLAVNAHACG